ncbi:MAG: tetratricopeptide repeat protein [Candidatus Eisenbacteria bacterium]
MTRAGPRPHGAADAPGTRHARPRGAAGTRLVASLVFLASLVVACGRHADPVPPADDAGRAQVLIDSGNQAFSAGNFGLAARRYAAAAVIKKDDPAAYYGLGMALSKLGRDEEARAAYARAREMARP